jgi:hypothetical protein
MVSTEGVSPSGVFAFAIFTQSKTDIANRDIYLLKICMMPLP